VKLVLKAIHKTHPFRAAFWVAMVPVAIILGLHESVFVVFLYSTYANFVGDISAWESKKSGDKQNEATT
jgi:hypothetical protein